MDLYRVLRPLLFALPPDLAHDVSQWVFRRRLWSLGPPARRPRLPMGTRVAGIELRNPFGLAAGFDKHGDLTPAMASLGFGFLVVGSVRAGPHPGNPRPWFLRRLEEEGLVNAMGLPSKGAAYVRSRLLDRQPAVPLLLSVVGESVPEMERAFAELAWLGQGWEVNLSCPNTETGRTFEDDLAAFEALLDHLVPLPGPVFLKLSPYATERGRERALEMGSRAMRRGVRNVVLCNTLPVEERGLGIGKGGLSGRPLYPLVRRAVGDFTAEWGEKVSIVGVGGVLRGGDACDLLEAGARAVEVLTALILRGPLVVQHLLGELEEELVSRGFASVQEAIGHAA